MTKDDFVKQFRGSMWDLALESFYQARQLGPVLSPEKRADNSEAMLSQMRAATDLLGKMYDAMNQKNGKEAPK